MRCAVYINNRIVTKRTHKKYANKTPYGVIMGQEPNLSNLKIFGCPVKVLKPKNIKTGKMSSKCWDGYHVGYAASGYYRIYLPREQQVLESNNVQFFENLYDFKRRAPQK